MTYKGRLSEYKVGKAHVEDWADYWIHYYELLNSGSSVEGKMAEYGQVIRSAFSPNSYSKMDEAMSATPNRIKIIHSMIIPIEEEWPEKKRATRIKQRQVALLYYFGTTEDVLDAYPDKRPGCEPNELVALFKRVGRAKLS